MVRGPARLVVLASAGAALGASGFTVVAVLRAERIGAMAALLAALGVLLFACAVAATMSRRSVAGVAAVLVVTGALGGWTFAGADDIRCGPGSRVTPGPVPAGGRLPATAQAALDRLTEESPPVADLRGDGGFGHHATGPMTPTPLAGDATALLRDQLECAADAAESLRTIEQVRAAGYVQGSTPTAGIGEHWIDWTAVGLPFNPSRPSMLLFSATRFGKPPELVGFSYWIGSAVEPEGFAGPDDHWHRHVGLCFIEGWLAHQSVGAADDCQGNWIEGSNLWMLHAWVAPGYTNRWGVFAVMNPSLCPASRSTPDVLRCDPSAL